MRSCGCRGCELRGLGISFYHRPVSTRTSPLRSLVRCLLAVAMLAAGTLSVDRAVAHTATAMAEAAQPPCHRAHHADGLALAPVNACDTVCAGATPESSYETPVLRSDLAGAVLAVAASAVVPSGRAQDAPLLRYGHGPPPLPPYLRDGRLLI